MGDAGAEAAERLCLLCSADGRLVRIRDDHGLLDKLHACLPITITEGCPLPDTICPPCIRSVETFCTFVQACLRNITALETRYEILDSCLRANRTADKTTNVDSAELFRLDGEMQDPETLRASVRSLDVSLVDYDLSDADDPALRHEREYLERHNGPDHIIDEIAQRKKRKNREAIGNVAKAPRLEEPSGRRKSRRPKKLCRHDFEDFGQTAVVEPSYKDLEYEPTVLSADFDAELDLTEKLLGLPSDVSVTREEPPPEPPETCLLCEKQFFGALALAGHMYDTHGIDLAQVFANVDRPLNKNRKIPNLVKISDVMAVRKQKSSDASSDDPPLMDSQDPASSPPSVSISKTHYTCSECENSSTYTTFKEYSTHRRAHHQIFHCDLCPKFYGRNSHLWKHVNRVHKGHPSITCQQCYKTSASKYHLAQHFNKMHSTKGHKIKKPSSPTTDDEFMNQKFQGFDFKSVRQSFLKQEMMDKEPKDMSDTDSESGKDMPKNEAREAPKEIDSTSNLYTNIITNYTPPTNEGPYKCPKCFKGFHKKNLLKKHKKNCRPRLQKDLLTRCKTCSRIFKDRQSLTKHLINYHSEYTCEICNLAVQSKCEIVSHIRFSHPSSELTCHCGQILRSKDDLLKHKSEHRDSHVCQFCGDMLPTKIKLKMHILSLHRKILSLSCGICLKLFETQHILKDHVRLVHGDQLAPLTSCTVCGKNYGSKWKTYDHLNKSHGRIFRACKTCLEVFETEADLQTHFETEHLNSKDKKKAEEKDYSMEGPDGNPNSQEYNRDDRMTSDSDDDDTNEVPNLQNIKTLQDDMEYRNYVIREYQQSFDKKLDNGVGKEKKMNQDNKISLLEKRLLGKKITEEDLRHGKKILENGGRYIVRKKSEDGNDMENVYGPNSSKRTVYVNSNDPSLCEICLKVWPAKKHLWQHYIRCHKQVAATVCGICLKTNTSYASLQAHLRETHPNLLHGCGFGSNFICKICGRYHNASSKLKLHMAIHVGYNEDAPEMEIKEEPDKQDMSSDSDKSVKKCTEEDINYESLIEEVEASSDSDNENTSKHSDELSSSCESDTSDDFIENDLEQEMLKNMIGENMDGSVIKTERSDLEIDILDQDIGEQVEIVDEHSDSDIKTVSTDVSQDGSYKDFEDRKVKTEACSSDEWSSPPADRRDDTTDSLEENLQKLFQTKADELDSAIRSISYECDDDINTQFTDLQNLQNTLTESELETAVGSIL